MNNQCDWCLRWLPLNEYWNHIDVAPWWIFWCSKHLYEKETTWQTVYEQLQEILNKCIIEWRWYRFIEEYLYCTPTGLRNNDVHSKYYNELISYHELFSKDSGIMEYVEWEVPKKQYLSKDTEMESIYMEFVLLDHYMIMWPMTAEQKIQYFLDNAIIPTK